MLQTTSSVSTAIAGSTRRQQNVTFPFVRNSMKGCLTREKWTPRLLQSRLYEPMLEPFHTIITVTFYGLKLSLKMRCSFNLQYQPPKLRGAKSGYGGSGGSGYGNSPSGYGNSASGYAATSQTSPSSKPPSNRTGVYSVHCHIFITLNLAISCMICDYRFWPSWKW